MEILVDLQNLFGLLCTAALIGWDPATPSLPPHLGLYTRALLVSQDRRHLFITPCLKPSKSWGHMVAPVHKKYQWTADSNSLWCYFLYAGKTHNRRFLEVFRGGLHFCVPQNCPSPRPGLFGGKRKFGTLEKLIEVTEYRMKGTQKSRPPRKTHRSRRLPYSNCAQVIFYAILVCDGILFNFAVFTSYTSKSSFFNIIKFLSEFMIYS